ncbi:MAG TPA: HEAT repeat domain-containing protein [Gemmataceae bacterium]|nr:HEAT repeat domain-containing protein [Gemmataceae bacterium]
MYPGKATAAAIALGLIVCATCVTADDKEPVYRNKPLSAWIEQLADRSATARQEAAEAIGKIGTAAKPAIGPLVAVLADSDDTVRDAATQALAAFGKDAVPSLLAALKHSDADADMREAAIRALGAIGPDAKAAAPALRDALTDKEQRIREAAAAALKRIEK